MCAIKPKGNIGSHCPSCSLFKISFLQFLKGSYAASLKRPGGRIPRSFKFSEWPIFSPCFQLSFSSLDTPAGASSTAFLVRMGIYNLPTTPSGLDASHGALHHHPSHWQAKCPRTSKRCEPSHIGSLNQNKVGTRKQNPRVYISHVPRSGFGNARNISMLMLHHLWSWNRTGYSLSWSQHCWGAFIFYGSALFADRGTLPLFCILDLKVCFYSVNFYAHLAWLLSCKAFILKPRSLLGIFVLLLLTITNA